MDTLSGFALASPRTENARIAQWLREAAHLLQLQGASDYRVTAYLRAAEALERLPRDVRALYAAGGVKGLDDIPHVGLGIASAIAEMLVTRRWSMLERLRGSADPVALLQTVPGIGAALARRIHDALHLETLEDLEAAAHDGRLAQLPGIGERRVAAWRASLGAMLGPLHAAPSGVRGDEPPAALLLDVDREYRERAAAGTLRTIAPRRFNPSRAAWLPILHAQRGAWHFTALYSNTAQAHRLGRMRDWVVIYYYDGDHVEHQCTVVTETRGDLRGQRVVRGREDECAHPARLTGINATAGLAPKLDLSVPLEGHP